MKKTVRILLIVAVLAAALCLFTGCFPGDGVNTPNHLAGFFWGVWHGWIAPISLIYSLFNHNIGIYEVNNNGFLYNLGFYMAVISGPFGLSLSRKKHER